MRHLTNGVHITARHTVDGRRVFRCLLDESCAVYYRNVVPIHGTKALETPEEMPSGVTKQFAMGFGRVE